MAILKQSSRRAQMQELRGLTRKVMAAFLLDIQNKKILVKDVEDAINDAQRLNELLELTGGDLVATTEAMRASLSAGGAGLIGRFNPNSEAATAWILKKSSQLVTDINEGQRESIRAIVATGRTLGESPRTTALDIVGRIGASGRREGGIVGLNAPQGRAASNAIYALRSGDPALMREYLKYERRDRRYDGIVKRAMAAGEPLSSADAHKIANRYQDRLLKTRGDTIARTETIEAYGQGRNEATAQVLESGALPEGLTIIKEWQSASDARDDHRAMLGVQVAFDEPFILPDGSQVMFPGDSSLGAPAEQIINCRCVVIERVVEI